MVAASTGQRHEAQEKRNYQESVVGGLTKRQTPFVATGRRMDPPDDPHLSEECESDIYYSVPSILARNFADLMIAFENSAALSSETRLRGVQSESNSAPGTDTDSRGDRPI